MKTNAGPHLRPEPILLPSQLQNPRPGYEYFDGHMPNMPNTNESCEEIPSVQDQVGAENPGAITQVDLVADPAADPTLSALGSVPSGTAVAASPGPRGSPPACRSPPVACPEHRSGATHSLPERGGDSSTEALLGSSMAPGSPVAEAEQAPSDQAPAPSPSPVRPLTRLQEGIQRPKVYTDGTVHYHSLFTSTGEPEFVEEALSSKPWKDAMDVEYDALIKNKTWHLVPPRKGVNIIDCKWVYKTKLKSDGSLDRYKARDQVVDGFTKALGVRQLENFKHNLNLSRL